MGRFDKIYFAIPEDGGPGLGPVLDRDAAERMAEVQPGYVVGIDIGYIDFSHVPNDVTEGGTDG